jgi:hypothetical protein
MPGSLELIQKETISASTSSVSIDNVFSSNYDVYKITISGVSTVGTSGTFLAIRFIDNSGSLITGNEYDWADLEMRSDTSFSDDNDTGVSFMRMNGVTDQSPESQGANINIYNPYDSSSYTFINGQSSGITTNLRGGKNIGVHKVAETIRGFAVIETNGSRPFNSGNICVYGVK